MGSEDPSSSRQKHTMLEVWYGVDGLSFGRQSPSASSVVLTRRAAAFGASAPASEASQPIVFDAQGDMMVDLLGVPEGSSRLQIWRNSALEAADRPFEVSA